MKLVRALIVNGSVDDVYKLDDLAATNEEWCALAQFISAVTLNEDSADRIGLVPVVAAPKDWAGRSKAGAFVGADGEVVALGIAHAFGRALQSPWVWRELAEAQRLMEPEAASATEWEQAAKLAHTAWTGHAWPRFDAGAQALYDSAEALLKAAESRAKRANAADTTDALAKWRERVAQRDTSRLDGWKGWLSRAGAHYKAPLIARYLLRALLPAAQREVAHRPAIARGIVHDGLLPLMARAVEVRDLKIIERNSGALVAELAPSVDAALAERLAQPGALDIFGRVHAHRLINRVARTVHEQKEAGVADFRAVVFEGGFSGLRDAIGYNDSKNAGLEELLNAGAGVQFVSPTIQGRGLWTWSNTKGPKGRLEIVAGAPMLPNFNEGYAGNYIDARTARRLIPVLEHEPRLDMLNPRSQGAALTLVWLMLVELRDHAEQLATSGAIRTTAARWRALAERAGLPAGLITEILDAWSARGGDAVQLIERNGAEWTLADPHALARDFIVEAGRRMGEGAANGRRAKKSKQANDR